MKISINRKLLAAFIFTGIFFQLQAEERQLYICLVTRVEKWEKKVLAAMKTVGNLVTLSPEISRLKGCENFQYFKIAALDYLQKNKNSNQEDLRRAHFVLKRYKKVLTMLDRAHEEQYGKESAMGNCVSPSLDELREFRKMLRRNKS
jgi:hypothetical protein